MRNYAQLNISVWNDDDFRALSPQAQHLYFLLLSHPTLSYCGVGDWRPARLARMATGWTTKQVEEAGAELVKSLFVLIDEDTEEFLVRTFVKNDPLMRQRNLGVSMARAFSLVASEGIRGVIVHELRRLEKACPELKGFDSDEVQTVLIKPSIDPSVYPCGDPSVKGSIDPYVDPSIDPYVDPSVKGQPNPSIDPSVHPSVDPSPTPAPTPAPLTTGKTSNERGEGVKGGPGGKGEPTQDDAPFYDSLDALAKAHLEYTGDAYGTITDPRCNTHKNLPRSKVPKCRACQTAGEKLKALKEQTRRERRAAIDACDLCDHNGKIMLADGLATCDHTTPPEAPQEPQTTQNNQTPTPNTTTPQTATQTPKGPF